MAINQEIISTSWEGQQKSYIEAGLKTLLQRMLEVLESPLAANSVGSNQLTQELRDVINSIGSKVPNTRTVNSKELSSNITIGPADIMVGNQTLADKLDDMDEAIGQGGDTSGLASRIAALEQALDDLTGTEDTTQIIDTFNEIVDFLNGIDTDDPTLANQLLALTNAISAVQTSLNSKANDADVVKSISVNGTVQQKTNGNVNIVVEGGSVESVTINGTNHTPNSQGVVDLGTVQGDAGPQGLTGNCNINDASQLITILVNNFTTGGAGNIASAETVKILRQNVDRVQANIQTLLNAIANFAFPQDKPQLTELDWNVPKNTVTINGVSNTVITRNGEPVSGSILVDYGTELTLLISPAQGYAITSLTADNGVLTDNGNGTYTLVITVTSNVTITFTGAASAAYSITYNLTNIQSASRPVSIISGGTASIALQPTSGYALTTNEITVVGATVVSYADNVLTISNPTGDVTVTAVAYDATNTAFRGVKYACPQSGNGWVEFGPQTSYVTSPLIDVGGVGNIQFNCGASVDRTVGLFLFDTNGNYIDHFMYNDVGRSVDISSLSVSYVRISVATSSLSSAYIKNAGTGEYLWQGSSIADASVLPDYTAFEASPYCLQPNSNGDFIGMCYVGSYNGKQTTNPSKTFGLGYTLSYSMSKRVLLPSGSNSIKFGTTGGSGDTSSYLALYKSVGGAKESGGYYDNQSANPRTQTINGDTWVECQLIFKTANYANATIYDNTHSVALWQPLSD